MSAKKDNHTHKNWDGGMPFTQNNKTRRHKHKRKMDLHPLYCKLAERGMGSDLRAAAYPQREGRGRRLRVYNKITERERGVGAFTVKLLLLPCKHTNNLSLSVKQMC